MTTEEPKSLMQMLKDKAPPTACIVHVKDSGGVTVWCAENSPDSMWVHEAIKEHIEETHRRIVFVSTPQVDAPTEYIKGYMDYTFRDGEQDEN